MHLETCYKNHVQRILYMYKNTKLYNYRYVKLMHVLVSIHCRYIYTCANIHEDGYIHVAIHYISGYTSELVMNASSYHDKT